LRDRAHREKKSLNAVLNEALEAGLGFDGHNVPNTQFDWLCGTWVKDEICEKVLQEQRQIDRKLWQ